jgi:hypothetical protein
MNIRAIIFAVLLSLILVPLNAQSKEWNHKFYVDDFNEPTDQGYSSVIMTGTFSNSATTNSDLTARIISSESSFNIDLYEYNRQPGAKLVYDTAFGTFKVKQGGEVFIIDAMAAEGGGIYVWKFKGTSKTKVTKEYALLASIFAEGGAIMIAIDEDNFDSGSSTYIIKGEIDPLPITGI